jgi:hypothetical protein
MAISMSQTWDTEDGGATTALFYKGGELVSAMVPAEPHSISLAISLRSAGLDVSFDKETGQLCGAVHEGGASFVFNVSATSLPVFPKLDAIEFWSVVPVKLARSRAIVFVAEINASVSCHCVSANLISGQEKPDIIRLSVQALRTAPAESLQMAANVLISKLHEVTSSVDAKKQSKRTQAGSASDVKT